MSGVDRWLDPEGCPAERPPLAAMADDTRELHQRIDEHTKRTGLPYLHTIDDKQRLAVPAETTLAE